ncbi:MAG: hypothetical protein AB7P03_15115 [Kofleriaceae bacterium]
MAEFRIETLARADATFGLRSRFSGTAIDSAANDAWIIVFDGDARFDRIALDPFSLDAQLGLPVSHNAVLGMVVIGNLLVEGAVLNTNPERGPFLLVTGSLTASDVVISSSELAIDGDLVVTHTVLGVAGSGRLRVGGATRAEVLVAGDHAMQLDGAVAVTVAQTGPSFRVGQPSEVKAAYWIGGVAAADGAPIRGLGSEGPAHLRQLDPDVFTWDAWEGMTTDDLDAGQTELDFIEIDPARAIEVIRAGESMLRGNKRWPVAVVAPFPVSLEVMGTGRVAKAGRRSARARPTAKPAAAKRGTSKPPNQPKPAAKPRTRTKPKLNANPTANNKRRAKPTPSKRTRPKQTTAKRTTAKPTTAKRTTSKRATAKRTPPKRTRRANARR